MIEPKRVLRALAEHWALLEPLCEHFDQGTLSLGELRAQLAAQQLDSTPQDITARWTSTGKPLPSSWPKTSISA